MAGSRRLAILALVGLSLAGCGNAADDRDASAKEPEFLGTPREYVEALRGCLDASGVRTDGLDSDDAGFVILDSDSLSEADISAARSACAAEIGRPKIAGLSEHELLIRFQARSDQHSCLSEAGLTEADPITFEQFVAAYHASQETALWEPTEGLPIVEVDGQFRGPTDLCPRSATVW